jgi:hypothetical protein
MGMWHIMHVSIVRKCPRITTFHFFQCGEMKMMGMTQSNRFGPMGCQYLNLYQKRAKNVK